MTLYMIWRQCNTNLCPHAVLLQYHIIYIRISLLVFDTAIMSPCGKKKIAVCVYVRVCASVRTFVGALRLCACFCHEWFKLPLSWKFLVFVSVRWQYTDSFTALPLVVTVSLGMILIAVIISVVVVIRIRRSRKQSKYTFSLVWTTISNSDWRCVFITVVIFSKLGNELFVTGNHINLIFQNRRWILKRFPCWSVNRSFTNWFKNYHSKFWISNVSLFDTRRPPSVALTSLIL